MGNKKVIAATTKKKINEGPKSAAVGMLRKLSIEPTIKKTRTNKLILCVGLMDNMILPS